MSLEELTLTRTSYKFDVNDAVVTEYRLTNRLTGDLVVYQDESDETKGKSERT